MSTVDKFNIYQKIADIVSAERQLADNKHFKITHSDHESFGVMLEEYEEVKEEIEKIKNNMDLFWNYVREDVKEPEKLWILKEMSKNCYNLIYESIQLAGVIDKSTDSICERGC